MDPDQALMDVRFALARGDLNAAREAFSALDDWLTRGGYFPFAWCEERPPSDM